MEQNAGTWRGAQNYHRRLKSFFCKSPDSKRRYHLCDEYGKIHQQFWPKKKTVNSDSM